MIKRTISVLTMMALSGCATVGTLDAYDTCATADVATTAVGLSTHTMAEGGHLANALSIKALGAIGGPVVAVILLSVAGHYALKAIDRPEVTAVVAGATCLTALNNARIIGAAK